MKMKQVIWFLTRHTIGRIKRFNVENRAQKLLNEKKPMKAPTYKASLLELEKLMIEKPEVTEEIQEKNSELYKNLRSVYVTSKDENMGGYIEGKDDSSKMPFIENENSSDLITNSPDGKYNIAEAIEIIGKYQNNTDTLETLSKKFKIDLQTLEQITMCVKVFDMYVPPKKKEKSHLEKVTNEMMPRMENLATGELAAEHLVRIERQHQKEYEAKKKKLKNSQVPVKKF